MNENIINDMSYIESASMGILDILRTYGMCEEENFKALTNIRNKASGAKSLASHIYNQNKTSCVKSEK